jgi:oligoribonuclease NrnB/cAMP/cGMP phosphodiesterase (DHH superfamily)
VTLIINQFARNHFQGGGHCNAAGGKSESMEETVKQIDFSYKTNDIKRHEI